MSDGYTLEHIIQECLSDKIGSSRTVDSARGNAYEDTWKALNAWIESRLSKRKGASISMLGTFTWETKIENGETSSRPIFLLSDSFIKNFNVRRQRIHSTISTAPSEEVNFSKLAIKFSTTLTKDMAFCGVREIVNKIGAFIERSYKFNVAFTFGVFKSNERKVKFEFDYTRLGKILPENFQPESFTSRTERSFTEDVVRDVDGRGSVNKLATSSLDRAHSLPYLKNTARAQAHLESPSNIPELQLSREALSQSSYVATSNLYTGGRESAYASTERSDSQNTDSQYSVQLSPGTQRVLQELKEKDLKDITPVSPSTKLHQRSAASDSVADSRFLDCLDDVKSQVDYERKIETSTKENYAAWVQEQMTRKDETKQKVKDLEKFLQTQIHEFHERKEKEKAERREARMKHELPGYIPPVIDGVKRNRTSAADGPLEVLSNAELVNSLDKQINMNRERKETMKKKQLEEEREYLNHVAMEMELQSATQRASHLEKQQTLLEAWEREAHIRNLKKLQKKGGTAVSSYLTSNLGGDPLSTSRSKSSLGGMGVGFDVRKVS